LASAVDILCRKMKSLQERHRSRPATRPLKQCRTHSRTASDVLRFSPSSINWKQRKLCTVWSKPFDSLVSERKRRGANWALLFIPCLFMFTLFGVTAEFYVAANSVCGVQRAEFIGFETLQRWPRETRRVVLCAKVKNQDPKWKGYIINRRGWTPRGGNRNQKTVVN